VSVAVLEGVFLLLVGVDFGLVGVDLDLMGVDLVMRPEMTPPPVVVVTTGVVAVGVTVGVGVVVGGRAVRSIGLAEEPVGLVGAIVMVGLFVVVVLVLGLLLFSAL
jgi:hypothetical protein